MNYIPLEMYWVWKFGGRMLSQDVLFAKPSVFMKNSFTVCYWSRMLLSIHISKIFFLLYKSNDIGENSVFIEKCVKVFRILGWAVWWLSQDSVSRELYVWYTNKQVRKDIFTVRLLFHKKELILWKTTSTIFITD